MTHKYSENSAMSFFRIKYWVRMPHQQLFSFQIYSIGFCHFDAYLETMQVGDSYNLLILDSVSPSYTNLLQ